jgi:hypothetical protein
VITPVFNRDHLHAARSQRLTPLVFDAETLLLAGDAALSPRELIADRAGELESLRREAIDALQAFAGAGAGDVAPLAAVLYRHARWIAKALLPAFVASCAGTLAPSPEPLRATHLLDGRPSGLADDTLRAIALGAAGVPVQTATVLPGNPPPRSPQPPAAIDDSTLFIAGPVEQRFMAAIADAWRRDGDGSTPRLVTRQTEDELLGDLAPPPTPPIDWRPLIDASSDRLSSLLWTNPGLEPHLRFLAGAYARAMRRQIARWKRLLETGRVARVVAAYPCVALDVAAAAGTPSVLLPHGPMVAAEDDLYRLTPATRIAAIGEPHARRLRSHGIGGAVVTGLPEPERAPAEPAPICDILILSVEPARPRDAGSLPRVWPDREIEAMRSLAAAARRRRWRLRLRRHPRYDRSIAFYRQIFGDALELSPPDRPLAADAAAAGLLLTFSGPSSVILDATRAGAAMLLGAESWAFATPEDWGLAQWPIARDAGKLERLIAEALASDGALESIRRRSARALRAFDGAELDPLARTVDLIASAQPRAATRTIRDERSTTLARG